MGGPSHEDTIAALSSGRPPAAIAIIRCSGSRAFALAEALSGSLPPPRRASLRQIIDPANGRLLDEALLLTFPGPATATGEDLVEFHCHGGRATVDAVLAALIAQPGCRLAEPGEFTRRALANGRIDLTEAEGLADLLTAETELQRRSAMARAGGALRQRLDEWRERLLILSAKAEVAIDYSDEDDGAVGTALAPDILQLRHDVAQLTAAPRVEPLRDGIRVVVAGPPNAGKSSLINKITGYDRAIVTPIAGTTRDVIEVPLAIGGIPYLFIDTAGLRDSDDIVEGMGIRRAQAEVERADILIWMGSPDSAPSGSILVAGKADLHRGSKGIAVSSLTGEGIDTLVMAIAELAGHLLPHGDELTVDRRHFDLLTSVEAALGRAARLGDPVLVAEELRSARASIDAISGQAGIDDLLDALFGRFCLGK